MQKFGKGLLAGLAATIVLSALMIIKAMMGLMPALDIPRMIAGVLGSPETPLVGWVGHFVIGIVGYGIAITLVGNSATAAGNVWRGLALAVVGWLLMMIVLMPLAGAGLFGLGLGIMAPIATLILHLIFGAVLGWVYGRLIGNQYRLSGAHT